LFDNPYGRDWQPEHPPAPKRRSVRVPLFVLGVVLGVLSWLDFADGSAMTVVPSANGLRQIEVVALQAGGAEMLRFYVHDAGYRLRHKAVLFATVMGAPTWHVVWDGPGAIALTLPEGWQQISLTQLNDLQVKLQ